MNRAPSHVTTHRWAYVLFIAVIFLSTLVVKNWSASSHLTQSEQATSLSERIPQLFSSPLLRTTRYGIEVYSLDRDTVLYAYNTHDLLVPASLTKLYYTATAFAMMGPAYRVRTVLATDGTIRDGTLDGNLYIIGHGDCLLTNGEIESLADRLAALGIKRITGAIIADASHFDPIVDRQQYSGDAEQMENLPPITALGVNGNRLTVIVTRGNGDHVRINTFPNSSGVVTRTSVISLPSRSTPHHQLKRKRQRYGDRVLYRHHGRRKSQRIIEAVRVSSALRNDGVQEIHVMGRPRPNASISFTVTMLNPPLVVAGAFERACTASGIHVQGGIRIARAPDNIRELAAYERPLHELVTLCNKNSDNFIAEHVMKILGAYCCGNTQCNVHAYRTVVALLDSLGIGSNGCVLFDGSGLSRRNRVTVASIIGLLRYCARQSWGDSFFETFAIAGQDGTLQRRMKGTAAEGNLRGKTGTHRNVSGLAGIVRSRGGERLLFATLWNGGNVGFYKRLENQLGEVLATYDPDDARKSIGSSPQR